MLAKKADHPNIPSSEMIAVIGNIFSELTEKI